MKPCKRRIFLKKVRKLEFIGPVTGKCHRMIVFNDIRLAIPSNSEYSIDQMMKLIKEISDLIGRKITEDEWNSL